MRSLIKRFFAPESTAPQIKFGRYSDSYKEDEKYDAWDRALELYEAEKYLDSFEQFLIYLKDDNLENLEYIRDNDDKIRFQFFQGSKLISGIAGHNQLKAEAKIAKANELNIGFLRRLIESNYHLEYTRYALDEENCISMVFDTFALDASPYKLYYALKELALNADQQDDILVSEFESLETVNTVHIRDISDSEKRIKYNFLIDAIEKTLNLFETTKLNIIHYPGAASYLILSTVYRLDFLLKPEGVTQEKLKKIQDVFFKKKAKSAQEKNVQMHSKLKKLLKTEYVDFKKELYETVSTFGVTLPSGHDRLRSLIDSELQNMDWYYNNGYDDFGAAIPGYIVGYCLYNFALPNPDKDLLILFYKIEEQALFNDLGYDFVFTKDGKLQKSAIQKAIKEVRNKNLVDYPNLDINYRDLIYEDPCAFKKSYLQMLRDMEVTKGNRKR